MNLRHQICACLYQGKACEVFLVRDIVTSQLYALKRIVRHHAKFSDAYLRAVYQREACMLGWLQHARIPHLISAYEEEQYRCILMEYIPGVSLSRIQGCSSEQKRLQWCLQLGELLRYLHEQQIVHLDIKPSNLQYWKGNVYLLDFATSRFLQEQDVAAAVSPRLVSQRGWYAEL